MVRRLLATTALLGAMTVAAWADDTSQQPGTDTAVPAAAAPQGDATAAPQSEPAAAAQSEPAAAPQGDTASTPAPAAPADTTAAVGRAAPGDALIAAQPQSHSRAEEIIGLSVVSAEGEEVGEVSDLILDDQHKLTGIVVGVGGFLGIGEKVVGISWSQADMRKDADSGKERIFVGLTKADLDAAPDFKTKEQAQSEAEAAAARSQMEQQQLTQPAAPAAGDSTAQ